jgi:DNA topoisomerase-1
MKSLVIVESPSKAKKIQEFLGKDYIVLATQGHIVDLGKGRKHGIGVDVDNKFSPKYVLMEDKHKIMDSLIGAAESSDQILIASDPDREGEAIAWHVANRLDGCKKPFKRVEFNEITKKGIQKGISKPRDIDQNLFHAQEARRILDRIVGFMVSPFLMTTFGPKLSAGRVQSVVTKMIIDREAEIQEFKPEEYWNIKANLKKKSSSESFWAKYDVRVTDKSDAHKLSGDLLDSNCFYEVISVESNLEKKKQPPPMITSELQRVMSRSFGFSPERTMKAAQSLYENGYVTYIRTDSVRIEDDALKDVRSWLVSSGHTVPKSPVIHKSKSDAQDAHECIRPTDLLLGTDNSELLGDEKKVYEIIWKYFVASQMEPAVYDTLKVTIKHSKNKSYVLKATGRALKTNGFLDVMGVSGEEKIDIPALSKGDVLELASDNSIVCERKLTQPPQRFSADTLIKAMEQKNIGRPATYAEVISKIAARNYVEIDGKYFKPTELGKKINASLERFFSFMNYNYTMDMEQKLDEVALGKLNHTQMLYDFFSSFKGELVLAYKDNGAQICELCKSPMTEKFSKSKNVRFLGCSAFPKCKSIVLLDNANSEASVQNIS